jgi:hypothetical protein
MHRPSEIEQLALSRSPIDHPHAEELEKINRRLVRYAMGLGIENGRRERSDATVTETNIHRPSGEASVRSSFAERQPDPSIRRPGWRSSNVRACDR